MARALHMPQTMENVVLATLALIVLSALATTLVAVVWAYLSQIDASLALEGAMHVASTLPVGRVDEWAHTTILELRTSTLTHTVRSLTSSTHTLVCRKVGHEAL